MAKTVLDLVYPPNEILVAEYSFDDDGYGITVGCIVPLNTHYTSKPISYVTAENFVRCLSQASYLLAEHVLEHESLKPVEMGAEAFRQAAEKHDLFYRNLDMTFHHRTTRGQPFTLRLRLRNWREIKRLGDFLLFTFTIDKTVISGEISFVFPVR
jgi:hypothetical protein